MIEYNFICKGCTCLCSQIMISVCSNKNIFQSRINKNSPLFKFVCFDGGEERGIIQRQRYYISKDKMYCIWHVPQRNNLIGFWLGVCIWKHFSTFWNSFMNENSLVIIRILAGISGHYHCESGRLCRSAFSTKEMIPIRLYHSHIRSRQVHIRLACCFSL